MVIDLALEISNDLNYLFLTIYQYYELLQIKGFNGFYNHWTSVICLCRDLTVRSRVVQGSRDPVQLILHLVKSSFPPYQRMPSRSLKPPRQPPLQSLPMAHMPHMALSTWSTRCLLSCELCSFCFYLLAFMGNCTEDQVPQASTGFGQ